MSATQTNRAHRRFGFLWAFVDFLTAFNAFLTVLLVLIIVSLTSQTEETEAGLVKNAEYIMSMTWPPEDDCDFDIWVRNPNGNTIYFGARDLDHMNIERDDMGRLTDTIIINGVVVPDVENAEYVTLRTFYEGEYLVNIHAYSCRDADRMPVNVGQKMNPISVSIEINKINPNFTTVFKEEVVFDEVWQEKTAVRFKLNAQGMFTYVDNIYEKLVTTTKATTP